MSVTLPRLANSFNTMLTTRIYTSFKNTQKKLTVIILIKVIIVYWLGSSQPEVNPNTIFTSFFFIIGIRR